MKMAMHIDKSQITTSVKATSGTGKFRRTPAIQAGFRSIAMMAVGGAGGRNTALFKSTRGAGGGGGGSVLLVGDIKDLPEEVSYSVGGKGADSSGYASSGGQSVFGPYIAYGGGGASAGVENFAEQVYPSRGGSGGGNNLNYGSGGEGGIAAFVFNTVNNPNRTLPTTGNYQIVGTVGGGRGGGGGAGRSGRNGYESEPSAGSTGNNTGGVAVGGGPVIDGHYGGYGGGANIAPVTGVNEYYGYGNGGVVVFKLT